MYDFAAEVQYLNLKNLKQKTETLLTMSVDSNYACIYIYLTIIFLNIKELIYSWKNC